MLTVLIALSLVVVPNFVQAKSLGTRMRVESADVEPPSVPAEPSMGDVSSKTDLDQPTEIHTAAPVPSPITRPHGVEPSRIPIKSTLSKTTSPTPIPEPVADVSAPVVDSHKTDIAQPSEARAAVPVPLHIIPSRDGSPSRIPIKSTLLKTPPPVTDATTAAAPVIESVAAPPVETAIAPSAAPATNTAIASVTPAPENLLQAISVPQTNVPQAQPGTTFLSLCYHDVQDADPDQTYVGVTTAKLVEQFSWFRDNGYVPISIDDILLARSGGKPLPEKAILLTFDDGYVSFYTRVFPLLKSYNYPAVLAVVDSWMEGGGKAGDGSVDYAGIRMPSSAFINWNQVREMAKSGLVEIASHTNASHKGIIANPQGNLEPAVVTHAYSAATKRYETDEEYAARLRQDFQAAARKIAHESGRAPRVMVWPYGQYNQFAVDAAAEAGMPITMTLDDGFGTVKDLSAVPRYLINADPDLQGFVVEMRSLKQPPPIRAAMIDLDLLYSPDHEQELKNLDAAIARVYAMKISTVFIKGYASDDYGVTHEVYFPNRHLLMREDLMNRVAWQLATRTNVKVYGVMPVLAYDFGVKVVSVESWSQEQHQTGIAPDSPRRISPFDPAGRHLIHDLYEDLGRAVALDGIVFENDAVLSEFEDASPTALAAYAAAGLPASIADIRADHAAMEKWTRLKTDALISLTRDLVNAMRKYRAPMVTVRKSYAAPIFDPASESRYAQEFGLFQNNYDFTAVLAMPYLENIGTDDAEHWMQKLIGAVKQYPAGLQRSIFLVQTVDWRQPKNSAAHFIPETTIAAQMRQLTRSGAMNFSFMPDDFVRDQPKEDALHGIFSLQTYPYRP